MELLRGNGGSLRKQRKDLRPVVADATCLLRVCVSLFQLIGCVASGWLCLEPSSGWRIVLAAQVKEVDCWQEAWEKAQKPHGIRTCSRCWKATVPDFTNTYPVEMPKCWGWYLKCFAEYLLEWYTLLSSFWGTEWFCFVPSRDDLLKAAEACVYLAFWYSPLST